MHKRGIGIILALSLGAFALPGLLAGETKVSTYEKSFALTPGQPVSVSFHDSDGDVAFTTGDVHSVGLTVRKETDGRDSARAQRLLDEITVEVTQNNNDVRIEIRHPQHHWFFFQLWNGDGVKVRSEVVLPEECRLVASTSDGSIKAAGIKGDVSLKTSDGTILLAQSEGRLEVHTSDGEITLRDVRGEVEARTSDGDLDVSGVFTRLSLRASDGSIAARILPGSRMESGWEIGTADGSVEVSLAPEFGADLWVHTSDGSINCNLPVTIQGKTEEHTLRGTLAGGGSLFTIKTSDGSVTLRTLSSSARRP